MASNDKKDVRCSFCGRTQDEVKRLIAGPNAYICNDCVGICADLINEEKMGKRLPTVFRWRADCPRLLK